MYRTAFGSLNETLPYAIRTFRSLWPNRTWSIGRSSRFTFQPRKATSGAIDLSAPLPLPTRVAPFDRSEPEVA
jgi:hypothetical protein